MQRGDKRRAWVRANDSYNIQNTRFCCLIPNHKHIGNLKWHMCTCGIIQKTFYILQKASRCMHVELYCFVLKECPLWCVCVKWLQQGANRGSSLLLLKMFVFTF